MERALRPEPRPSHRTRALVALGLSLWTALQAMTLVVAAIRGGTPDTTYTFFYTGLFTMALAAASWVAWRWAHRARPLSFESKDEPDPTEHHHGGITGEYEPPTRW